MPISNEQWRVVVGLWVARIQQTLIIRRGVKRSPSSQEGAPCPLGQPHSGEKKCMVKKKGRKKPKNDSFGDSAISTDEFYNGLIALAMIVSCLGRNKCKDGSYRNPVGPLLEMLGGNGLGALVVIAILLLRSGDVETNPGPVVTGGWLYLVNNLNESSTYCTVVQVMLAVTNTLAGHGLLARLKSLTRLTACQCTYQGVDLAAEGGRVKDGVCNAVFVG